MDHVENVVLVLKPFTLVSPSCPDEVCNTNNGSLPYINADKRIAAQAFSCSGYDDCGNPDTSGTTYKWVVQRKGFNNVFRDVDNFTKYIEGK